MYRILIVLHRWLAIVTAIPLTLIALSGMVVVFEGPIGDAGAVHVARGTRVLSLDSLAARAIAAAGGGTIASVAFGRTPEEAIGFAVARDTAVADVLVNPYTGETLGAPPPPSVLARLVRRVHQFHTSLLAGNTGRQVVRWSTLSALLLLLTGLVIWWREKVWRIRWSASWKRIVFDLHHALGIFTAAVLLVIVGTGTWMAFERVVDPLVLKLNRTPVPSGEPALPAPDPGAVPVSLDAMVRSAHAAVPGAPVVAMMLRPGSPALVALRYPEDHTPAGRSRVFIDPYHGTVLGATSTRTAQAGTKLMTLQRPLHTGDIFGAASQAIWLLAALVLASQAVTGIVMWWNGRAARRPRRASPT